MAADHDAGRGSLLLRTGLRKLSLVQIRYLAPLAFRSRQPTVARVYRDLEQQFGVLAPPIALHAAVPDLLAASWIILRESLIVPGTVPRAVKEAVAVVVSEANTCPFCVTMHSFMLTSQLATSPQPTPALDATLERQVRAAEEWARHNTRRERGIDEPAPPFPAAQTGELVAVSVMMQYLNRMVNVFLGAAPLPPGVPNQALRVVGPILTWLQRSAQASPAEPGAGLDLLALDPALPAVPPPTWAHENSIIAESFELAAIAAEQAGRRSVPPSVRELIRTRLVDWDGGPTGLSRSWVEDAVLPLPAADRPAGRLALLVAFASYQIDAGVIADFQATSPGDAPLLELVAWASLSAALEVGSWTRFDGSSQPDLNLSETHEG